MGAVHAKVVSERLGHASVAFTLEAIGVLLRPQLSSVMVALEMLWQRADEAERADFVDAVLRIAGRENEPMSVELKGLSMAELGVCARRRRQLRA